MPSTRAQRHDARPQSDAHQRAPRPRSTSPRKLQRYIRWILPQQVMASATTSAWSSTLCRLHGNIRQHPAPSFLPTKSQKHSLGGSLPGPMPLSCAMLQARASRNTSRRVLCKLRRSFEPNSAAGKQNALDEHLASECGVPSDDFAPEQKTRVEDTDGCAETRCSSSAGKHRKHRPPQAPRDGPIGPDRG